MNLCLSIDQSEWWKSLKDYALLEIKSLSHQLHWICEHQLVLRETMETNWCNWLKSGNPPSSLNLLRTMNHTQRRRVLPQSNCEVALWILLNSGGNREIYEKVAHKTRKFRRCVYELLFYPHAGRVNKQNLLDSKNTMIMRMILADLGAFSWFKQKKKGIWGNINWFSEPSASL